MKYAVEQSPHNEIIVEQVDNCAEAPGQSKSTRTSRAILRQPEVESFGSGRSNVGSPSGRLGPVFSFDSESKIHRLQEATAASTATAAMMAMLQPERRSLKSPPSRVVAAAAKVRTAATDDSTAVATAAKSTAMEMVIWT